MGFTECGHHVSAVYPVHGHPLAKTSVVRGSFPYSGRYPLRSLQNAIQRSRPDVIVPCDDRAVDHLHLLHAQSANSSEQEIASLIERSLGNPAGYHAAQSRSALIAIAVEEGIRVPATAPLSSLADLRESCEDVKIPCVLKADGSWGGHGVRIARNLQQAEGFYHELAQPLGTARFLKRLIVNRDPYWLQVWREHITPGLIVQAHVNGRPANMTAACWEGEMLDAISADVVQAQGATGSATVVRIIDNPEMLRAAEILARRLGLSGFFGLDFMIEEGTGEPYLIEMNPRCTPLSHLALGMGRDPIAAFAARMSGLPVRARKLLTESDRIAYFPQAWHWDPESELLKTSFCDVPAGEPELVRDLLQLPWPDRSFLARWSNQLRRKTFQDRHSRGGIFAEALTAPRSVDEQTRGVATHR